MSEPQETTSPTNPLKIAVLSLNKNLYSTSRLVAAAEQRGHEARVIDYLKCHMEITSHRPRIFLGDEPLSFDAATVSTHERNPDLFALVGIVRATHLQAELQSQSDGLVGSLS